LTQLIEVVSDLLRERLGPTSEYVSSLIGIQAAYINTNHPDFVAGSAAIAREGPSNQKPPPKASPHRVLPLTPQVPSQASSPDDDEDAASSDAGSAPPNGPPLLKQHHPRSASTSVPDIRRPSAPIPKSTEKRNHHRAASGSQQPGINSLLAPQMPGSVGTSPQGAKETFLHYFFGSTEATAGHPSSAPGSSDGRLDRARGLGRPPPTSNFASREILPDLASGRRTTSRSGLDTATTAFDMKSLGKHIEAVSHKVPTPSLTS
jgi:dynamin 1-like protein